MIVKLQTLEASRFSLDRSEDLRDRWTELAGDCFMIEPSWLENAWRYKHVGEPGVGDNNWRGLAVNNSCGEVVGLAPWFVESRYGIRRLRLAGSGQICSDYVRLPAKEGFEVSVAETIARELADSRRASGGAGAVDLVEIEGHEVDSQQWNYFFDVMAGAGWQRCSTGIEGSWRIALPGSWEEFELMLHKSRRRKARRGIKLLEKGEIEHRVYDTVQTINEIWPEFVRLHQMRREQLGQPGCFSDPAFETFLRTAVLELAESGRAWLSMIWQDQKPLAVLLMFDSPKTSFMYQSGIDVARMQLAPGHIINALTIRHAIRRGKKNFDLLRGDEPYKAGWMATRIPLGRTRLFAPTLKGRALYAACIIRNKWRTWSEQRKATSAANVQEEAVDED